MPPFFFFAAGAAHPQLQYVLESSIVFSNYISHASHRSPSSSCVCDSLLRAHVRRPCHLCACAYGGSTSATVKSPRTGINCPRLVAIGFPENDCRYDRLQEYAPYAAAIFRINGTGLSFFPKSPSYPTASIGKFTRPQPVRIVQNRTESTALD